MNFQKDIAQIERDIGILKAGLLTNNRDSIVPRPRIIEFTGSPSSGKTTLIKSLDTLLRSVGFRVFTPQEGAEAIRHVDRTTPLYNIRTGLYALSIIIDSICTSTYDIVILDRGAFDVHAWMTYWRGKEKLDDETQEIIQSFFLGEWWIENTDVAYIITCEAAEALRRETEVGIPLGTRSTTTHQGITTLRDRYRQMYDDLSVRYPQLRYIDTTKMDRQSMVRHVTKDLLHTVLGTL